MAHDAGVSTKATASVLLVLALARRGATLTSETANNAVLCVRGCMHAFVYISSLRHITHHSADLQSLHLLRSQCRRVDASEWASKRTDNGWSLYHRLHRLRGEFSHFRQHTNALLR